MKPSRMLAVLCLLSASPPAAAQVVMGIRLESPGAYGGDAVAGTVSALRVAVWETSVSLESSHPEVVSVPASVAIAADGRGAFTAATRPVTAPTLVTITAGGGRFTRSATLRVLPAERLSFEELPAGTRVSDQYRERGVSLAATAEPPEIVRLDGPQDPMPEHPAQGLLCGGPPLVADFLAPVSWVRLQVRISGRVWGSQFGAWLRVYGQDGDLLPVRGYAFIGHANGPLVPVEIDAGGPAIHRVELRILSRVPLATNREGDEVSEENALVVKLVDNLQFSPHGRDPRRFLRGDANGDGVLDLSDAVFLLGFLFAGGREPGCLKSADFNDSGALDTSDAIGLLGFRFRSGPPPAAPFPACDTDPTPDHLSCVRPAACP